MTLAYVNERAPQRAPEQHNGRTLARVAFAAMRYHPIRVDVPRLESIDGAPFLELLHAPARDLLGRGWFEFVHPDSILAGVLFWRDIRDGRGGRYSIVFQSRYGRDVPVEIVTFGDGFRVVGVFNVHPEHPQQLKLEGFSTHER